MYSLSFHEIAFSFQKKLLKLVLNKSSIVTATDRIPKYKCIANIMNPEAKFENKHIPFDDNLLFII